MKSLLYRQISVAGFFSILLLLPLRVQSGNWYFETGFGAGQMMSARSFFGVTQASQESPGLGAAVNITLANNLSSQFGSPQIHLGIQDRLVTGSSSAGSMLMNALYPLIRIEIGHLYVGGGISPLVYRRSPSVTGMVSSSVAYMGQGGLLWKIVPFFYLNLEGAAQMVSSSGSTSPSPSIEGTLNFRFIWGKIGDSDGDGKFDGWRYPFGIGVEN